MGNQTNIIGDYNLSPNQVKELVGNGYEIIATPHIGNKWRSDLYNIQMGVKMAVFTGNCSKKDILDRPDKLLIEGKEIRISEDSRQAIMSPHLSLDQSKLKEENLLWVKDYGKTPAQIHHNTSAEVNGEENNILDFDYIFNSDEKLDDILNVLINNGENIFDRKVLENGIVVKYNQKHGGNNLVQNFHDLKSGHMAAIKNGEAANITGVIPNNPTMVLCVILRSLLKQVENGIKPQGTNTVYTVSGPSMIKYSKGNSFKQTFERMYKVVRKHFPEYPEQLDIHMLPGGIMDFIPTEEETELVDLISEVTACYEVIKAKSKHIAAASSVDERKLKIAEVGPYRQKYKDLSRDLNQSLKTQTFFSQYDAIQKKTKLLTLECLNNLPFKEINKILTIK